MPHLTVSLLYFFPRGYGVLFPGPLTKALEQRWPWNPPVKDGWPWLVTMMGCSVDQVPGWKPDKHTMFYSIHDVFLNCSTYLVGGFKYFLFSPGSLGKWSYLTNIFQMGWNHQLDIIGWLSQWLTVLNFWGWCFFLVGKISRLNFYFVVLWGSWWCSKRLYNLDPPDIHMSR